MTIDEFFDVLALTKNKYEWRLDRFGDHEVVRAESDDDFDSEVCPVTAVHAFQGFGDTRLSEHARAGRAIGLPDWLRRLIVAAADDRRTGASTKPQEPNTVAVIRKRMLEVLGL
jgi:hypothetical protein